MSKPSWKVHEDQQTSRLIKAAKEERTHLRALLETCEDPHELKDLQLQMEELTLCAHRLAS